MADLMARQGDFSAARAAIEDALSFQKKVESGSALTTVKLFAQVSTAELITLFV